MFHTLVQSEGQQLLPELHPTWFFKNCGKRDIRMRLIRWIISRFDLKLSILKKCKNSNLQWLGYNIVNSTVAIILMFIYLQAWYLGIRCKSNQEQDKRVRKLIEKSWKDLGKMTQEEILVLIAFAILVLSWFFREPGFMKGRNSFFGTCDIAQRNALKRGILRANFSCANCQSGVVWILK